jgi:AraC-like DNA-binding protein
MSSLIFIITFFTTILFLIKNNQSENEKISLYNEQFIEQVQQQIDNKLAITNNVVYNLSINQNIKNYARDVGNYYYNTIKVMDELDNYLVSSSNLDFNIALTKKNDELFITTSQTYSYEDYYEFLGLDENWEELNNFILNDDENNIIFESALEDGYKSQAIVMAQKVRVFPNDRIIVLLIFYSDELLPEPDNETFKSLAIMADENMYGNMDEEGILSENITSDIIKEHFANQSDRPIYIRHLNNKYSVYYRKSVVMKDWYYLMLAPSSGMFKNVEDLVKYYIIVWLTFLVAGIFISYITIQRAKKPIRLAMGQLGEYRRDSDKDELNFIVEKISEINKVNEDLNGIINKNEDIIKTKFLRDLCRGLLSSEEIEKKARKYDLLGYMWIAGIIDFSKNTDIDDMFSRDSFIQIKSHIAEFFGEQLSSQIPNEVFEYDQTKYIILVRGKEIIDAYSSMKDIISIVEMSFDIDLIVTLGNPVEKIHYISDSVMKAISVLDYIPSFDKRRIVTYKDINIHKGHKTYFYPLEIEKNLIQYAAQGSKEETLAVLDYLLKENIDNKNFDNDNINYLINAIILTINRILHKINKNIEDFYGENTLILFEIKNWHNVEEMQEKITKIFADIVSSVSRQNEEESTDLAEKMILFIKLNYMKDISLLDMSQKFNISMGYVGKTFKKHIGENFKEFLNIYRVEKAKELLTSNRDIKIKDLASMVGCTSDNSFIRIFKRYEGISPGQYQEELFRKR